MVLVELSIGDITDRVSILKIKNDYITDLKKLENVRNELEHLERYASKDVDKLEYINRILWDVENEIRRCESEKNFGIDFIRLARLVYITNDMRAKFKYTINSGSKIIEEKQYTEYLDEPNETVILLTDRNLSDFFVCNGIIRELIKKYKIILYSKKHDIQNIQFMFRDVSSYVTVVNEDDYVENQDLKTIYLNTGLDPEIMGEEFFVLRSRDREEKFYKKIINFIKSEKYIVIHDDVNNRISIETHLPIVRIDKGDFAIESENIFDYCTFIERAEQYYGFDDSFSCLIKLMKLRSDDTTFILKNVV
jgi:hypothetical protein